MGELTDSGVASITEKGVIYSRRLVRDEEIRGIRRRCGTMGGNPHLLNQNSSKREAALNQRSKQNESPSFSFSPSSSNPTPLASGFEEFWSEYPNKVYRGEIEKVWNSLQTTPDLNQPFVAEPPGTSTPFDAVTVVRTNTLSGPARFYRAIGRSTP